MSDRELDATRRRAFGATLRLMRSEAGLTQEQLAHKAGLARTYVGSVETGNRNVSLHAIWQLATALHASPRSFFPAVEPDAGDGTAKAPAHISDKG